MKKTAAVALCKGDNMTITRRTRYHLRSVCECGKGLPYAITPLMQPGQRVCPKCGSTHYADEAPIDWAKVKDHESKKKTGQGGKE